MVLKTQKSWPNADFKPLAQSYLLGEYSLQTWRLIVKNILELIEEERRFQLHDPVDKIKKYLKQNYLDKPTASTKKLLLEEPICQIFSQELEINGLLCKPLTFYMTWLLQVFNKHIECSISHLTQIHGNLQLSNLEFDQHSAQLKIRSGSTVRRSNPLYGDYRLDLAKLVTSFVDYTDLIAVEHFFMLCDDNKISLDIKRTEKHLEIVQIFTQEINKRYSNESLVLRFGQAIELIRMAELYENQLNRQLALLTLAVMHLERLYKDLN